VWTHSVGFGLTWGLVASKHGQVQRKEIEGEQDVSFIVWPYGHQVCCVSLKTLGELQRVA